MWDEKKELLFTNTIVLAIDRTGPRPRSLGVEKALHGGCGPVPDDQLGAALTAVRGLAWRLTAWPGPPTPLPDQIPATRDRCAMNVQPKTCCLVVRYFCYPAEEQSGDRLRAIFDTFIEGVAGRP
jgi:hypothetical protein